MSPQTRRGRTAQPGYRKAARAITAAGKPVSAEEELAEEGLDDVASKPIRPEARPVRRQRGMARVRRTSGYKYVNEAVGAYVPLLIAFIVLFAGVWAWISFGPHTPTPKENWTQIENVWKPKRDADLTKVSAAARGTDLNALLGSYKALRDDTNGWMGALAKIPDWTDTHATASVDPNLPTATALVGSFIQDGNAEVGVLDQMATSKSMYDVLTLKDSVDSADQLFVNDYEAARVAIFGVTPQSSVGPTIALPSGVACGSPGASSSPGSSAGPTACVPAPSGSPVSSGSSVSSGSLAPSGTPTAGASATPS